MNTLSFKVTLTLALIALSSRTITHTSSFAHMAKRAVPVASLAFFAQQTQQQKANQTDEAKKPTVTNQPTSTGPTFNTPIAAAVAQTKTATALSWIRSLLPVARCEEMEQKPSAEQKPSIDFSKIRKIGEVYDKTMSILKSFPLIAKYTLPNGKELWFFLDRHDNPESKCSNFAKTLVTNENFTHGIIEAETLIIALIHNNSSVSFQKYYHSEKIIYTIRVNTYAITFTGGINSMIYCAKYGAFEAAFIELNKQEKIIMPGEFSTPQEAIEAYKQEGLSFSQIFSICRMFFKEILVNKAALTLFNEEDFSFDFSKEEKKSIIMDTLADAFIFARDKKIAQTIIETMHDSKSKKVLIIYGAAHHATLAPLLEEHFGKPEYITPEQYAETIETRRLNYLNFIRLEGMITAEEYEELLAAPEKRISAVATMLFMAFTFIGGMRI